MKEQYIRQVKRQLHIPGNKKKDVVRDLHEIFSSAMEHGETEQQVIARLGSPREFADSTAEQLGLDNAASQKHHALLSAVAALIAAAACFACCAVAKSGQAPHGAIGQADAMTHIQIEGAFPFNILQLILLIGIAALAFSAAQLSRSMRMNRRAS